MKAMILAGGLSTRLYPLTKRVPKPLVPVAGEPNAVHVIRYLHAFGVEDIAINVHYLGDQIEAKLGDGSAYGVRLHYLREPELLGSAGALKQMQGFFDDTFVVVGCDDLTDLRLDALVAFHKKREALATIALAQADDVTQYGVVVLDAEGRIREFQEKPARGEERSKLVNTGVYVFEPAILERIPAGAFYDFGRDVFPALQRERANFYGLALNGAYWCDIGTPAEYRRATRDVLAGCPPTRGSATTCASRKTCGSERAVGSATASGWSAPRSSVTTWSSAAMRWSRPRSSGTARPSEPALACATVSWATTTSFPARRD